MVTDNPVAHSEQMGQQRINFFFFKRQKERGKQVTVYKYLTELEKSIKEAPYKSRKTVVKNLISGALCEKPLPHNHHVSKDKLTSACRLLLGKVRSDMSSNLSCIQKLILDLPSRVSP